jgi:aryl-phospho-beta-D-glucosidase BglC (GH1 family)
MTLPALATRGNRIVRRETGEPVRLRGVNRSGLEYGPLGAGITEVQIDQIVNEWGSNIIRLPFNQDWALNGSLAFTAEQYLQSIDQVIAWTSARGAYTLLDLQWINTEVKIAPLPDFNSPQLWRALAHRYRDEPAVLYDLYNEPHDTTAADWRYWATLLTDTIRAEHPEALIFVSGLDWGYDLRGVQIEARDVVYSTHVYPWKTQPRWDRAFGNLASEVPVFAGEWGGRNDHLDWGQWLIAYFNELDLGWTAWSWVDDPHLQYDGVPTPFGEIVKSALNAELSTRAAPSTPDTT